MYLLAPYTQVRMYAVDSYSKFHRHDAVAPRALSGIVDALRGDRDPHVQLAALEALHAWEGPAHDGVEAVLEHLARRHLQEAPIQLDRCSDSCKLTCRHRHLARCFQDCEQSCRTTQQLDLAAVHVVFSKLELTEAHAHGQVATDDLVAEHVVPMDLRSGPHNHGRTLEELQEGTPEHAHAMRRLTVREHGLRRLGGILDIAGNTKIEMRMGIDKGFEKLWGSPSSVGAFAELTLRDVLDIKLGMPPAHTPF